MNGHSVNSGQALWLAGIVVAGKGGICYYLQDIDMYQPIYRGT
jgi:hypothetical protein